MKLALRKTLPTGSDWKSRTADFIIKNVIHTKWGHSGIVIKDQIYHATARKGLIKEDFNPEGWDVFDLGDERDEELILLFNQRNAKAKKGRVQYDWFSLLAFTPLIHIFKNFRDSSRLYCYEWCWEVLTGKVATTKIVPEDLLQVCLEKDKTGMKSWKIT